MVTLILRAVLYLRVDTWPGGTVFTSPISGVVL